MTKASELLGKNRTDDSQTPPIINRSGLVGIRMPGPAPPLKKHDNVQQADQDYLKRPATDEQRKKLRFFGCTWDENLTFTVEQANHVLKVCRDSWPVREAAYTNPDAAGPWNNRLTISRSFLKSWPVGSETHEARAKKSATKRHTAKPGESVAVPPKLFEEATVQHPIKTTNGQKIRLSIPPRHPPHVALDADKIRAAENEANETAELLASETADDVPEKAHDSGFTVQPRNPNDRLATDNLDMDKVRAIESESYEVTEILCSLMAEDSPSNKPNAPAPLPTFSARSEIRASSKSGKFAGLDVTFHPILERLLSKGSWTQTDFCALAREFNEMPLNIRNVLNEWSDDALGDFILEGEHPVNIRRELIKKATT
jgi:TerB-C domain